MNIIELLEKYNINKETIIELNTQQIVTITHQLEVDIITNSLIDKNLVTQLIDALTNYKDELQFVINNRVLHHLFSNKDLPSSTFPKENSAVSSERIKLFLGSFLEDEMILFFDQNLAQNNFEAITNLMVEQRYFPERVSNNLLERAFQKVEFGSEIVALPNSDLSKILYLKNPAFYEFLSYLRSPEMDEKLKVFLNRVDQMYANNKGSEFAGTTIISMYNYQPFDTDFLALLKKKRDEVYVNKSSYGTKKNDGFPWKTVVVGLIIIVRVGFFIVKWNSGRPHYHNYDSGDNSPVEVQQEMTLDPYYTNMKKKIDSFDVFLVDYNKAEMNYVKYNDTIKTGENPFENLYVNPPVPSNGSPIFFKNKTKWDLILLENPLAYDSIKMPGKAYFIKSGTTYKLDDVPTQLNRVFNFYIGKKLASFKTNSNHIFVRNHSVMEPRFSILLPNSKAILKQNYTFTSDVTVAEKENKIIITSNQK